MIHSLELHKFYYYLLIFGVYIEKLKEHFDNLEVHYISVPAECGPYYNLKKAFERIESPAYVFHYVDSTLYEHARQLNVRTLLTGFGGDMTVSHNGGVVIFQYLNQLKLSRAYKLFIKRYRESNRSFKNHLIHEVLYHIPLFKIFKSNVTNRNDYMYFPLNEKYLNRIMRAENAQSYMYNKSFAIKINNGEMVSTLLSVRKHATAFQLEYLSPLLSKEVCALFLDIPGEELFQDGIRRSLIKGAMKNLVPKEIITRTDKMPYSPDSVSRIARIQIKDLDQFIGKNIELEEIGIDYAKLYDVISKIDSFNKNTEWEINKQLFYIPLIVIAIKFLNWIRNKSG